jgi:hypothetical protein
MTPTPSIAQGLTIGDLLRWPGLSPQRRGGWRPLTPFRASGHPRPNAVTRSVPGR